MFERFRFSDLYSVLNLSIYLELHYMFVKTVYCGLIDIQSLLINFAAYAKKEIPSLNDKVSMLKHIGKGVSKRLNDKKISTVKEFLVLLNTNPQELREVILQFSFIRFQLLLLIVYRLCPTRGNTSLLPLDCNIIGRNLNIRLNW